MHSGIGPAADLEKFNIPVVADIPAVGQGLRDHYFVPLILARNPETNDRNTFFQDPAAMEAAMQQWEESNTGMWTRYGCQVGCGWFKSERITSTPEFKALSASVQEFMNRETIPHYEMITHLPIHFMLPDMFKDYSYIGLAAFMMNEQSLGEVRLQSSNPDIPLLFNPRFLENPFDRRACIEIYKHLLEVSRTESFAKDTVSTLIGPASDSDEDILEFWKSFLSSSWHMTGTVKMGKADAGDVAVDGRFRVRGLEGLRVADMSVVPVLTNNHTQATAYVTGATCADVLIKEYRLDG
jgi:choline dehydrogenase-like flavoprotein